MDSPAPEPSKLVWMVTKTTRGCEARLPTHCPPNVSCNPPPPRPWNCTDKFDYPLEVSEVAGTCTATPHQDCPYNARCKAPQPITVPCPK